MLERTLSTPLTFATDIAQPQKHSTYWESQSFPHFLGYGTVLYGFEQMCTYPSQILKTKLQVDLQPNRPFLRELLHLCQDVYRAERIRGFYKGVVFSTVSTIPAQLFFLSTYGWSKDALERRVGPELRDSPLVPLCAGALAETVTCAMWVPIDVIVQKIQIEPLGHAAGWRCGLSPVAGLARTKGPSSLSSLEVARKIWLEDGITGFWRGTDVHLLLFVPQGAIWWASYEHTKKMLNTRMQTVDDKALNVMAGMSAGVISSTLTNPLDIVKVRIQTKVEQSTSIVKTLVDMVRREGLRSLGKGLAPKIFMSVPVSALSSFLYETLLSLSRKENPFHIATINP
mmetsp:Transcript_31998/g.101982  ORF Transcript_31998/g.101982 Transcript_31998/m.101982 type:complete len:342 (-) Transcript_31998:15-1040(-)